MRASELGIVGQTLGLLSVLYLYSVFSKAVSKDTAILFLFQIRY